jgi:hypothetical protein
LCKEASPRITSLKINQDLIAVSQNEKIELAVTIDVEEEGLFRNVLDARDVPVKNVPELHRLDSIFREFGIRPTLLVTHAVACKEPLQELLLGLKDQWRGEIGAHLHHWNTPPLEPLPYPDPVPSELIPLHVLEAKMSNLYETLAGMGVNPVSFRMGRFNIGPKIFSLLEKHGMKVDSSIIPMRRFYGGPDHLSVPTDPYFPDPDDPRRTGDAVVLEAPLTVLPATLWLGPFLERLGQGSIVPQSWISRFAMNVGSLAVQPVWTGLRRLKWAVLLHRRRGGRVLTIFFHSSELMPGGSRDHPTSEHVEQFLERLRQFLSWLHSRFAVHSLTLSQLGDLYRAGGPAQDRVDRG